MNHAGYDDDTDSTTCNEQYACMHSTDGYSRLRVGGIGYMIPVGCRLAVVGVGTISTIRMIVLVVGIRGVRAGIGRTTPTTVIVGRDRGIGATPIP
jgi:hypothetical protein